MALYSKIKKFEEFQQKSEDKFDSILNNIVGPIDIEQVKVLIRRLGKDYDITIHYDVPEDYFYIIVYPNDSIMSIHHRSGRSVEPMESQEDMIEKLFSIQKNIIPGLVEKIINSKDEIYSKTVKKLSVPFLKKLEIWKINKGRPDKDFMDMGFFD